VRLEGLGKLKSPVTSSGIEPTSFRILSYCLNQIRYRVPLVVAVVVVAAVVVVVILLVKQFHCKHLIFRVMVRYFVIL
jgi:hypothetical protein